MIQKSSPWKISAQSLNRRLIFILSFDSIIPKLPDENIYNKCFGYLYFCCQQIEMSGSVAHDLSAFAMLKKSGERRTYAAFSFFLFFRSPFAS